MSYRHKIIVLSSLVAFFSITLVLGLLLLPYGPVARRVRTVVKDFDPTQITRVEIFTNSENKDADEQRRSIVLERVAGSASVSDEVEGEDAELPAEWYFLLDTDFLPAQNDRIENLFAAVDALEQYRTVTSNNALYDELGFDEGEARVRLYNQQNEIVVDIIQGAADPQRGVYARLYESDSVYLISDELIFYLMQRPGYWQHTALFPPDLSAENVISMSIVVEDIAIDLEGERINAAYTLIRSRSQNSAQQWTVQDDPSFAVDSALVDSTVSAVLILQADSFSALSPRDVEIETRSQAHIDIATDAGLTYRIRITENTLQPARYFLTIEGTQILTKGDGSNYLYNVNEFSLRPLLKPLSALVPPPLEAEEEAEIVR